MHHRPPGNCNYGGVFIVFDRVFGTYVPESEHLDYYGLTKQYHTFDPVWANAEHASRAMKNVKTGSNSRVYALCRRRVKHKWVFEPMALFRPIPEPKSSLWQLPKESKRPKYDPEIPVPLQVYLAVLFLLQSVAFLWQGEMIKTRQLQVLCSSLLCRQVVFFTSASCMGRLFDGYSTQARHMNAVRALLTPCFLLASLPDDALLFYSSVIDLSLWVAVDMCLLGSSYASTHRKHD